MTAVSNNKPAAGKHGILPVHKQTNAWRKANRKMKWRIAQAEFKMIPTTPLLTSVDSDDGFIGVLLNYGFGDDGDGFADAVLSAKMAWDYVRGKLFKKNLAV